MNRSEISPIFENNLRKEGLKTTKVLKKYYKLDIPFFIVVDSFGSFVDFLAAPYNAICISKEKSTVNHREPKTFLEAFCLRKVQKAVLRTLEECNDSKRISE